MDRFTAHVSAGCTKFEHDRHAVTFASKNLHAWAAAIGIAEHLALLGGSDVEATFRWEGKLVDIDVVKYTLEHSECDATGPAYEDIPF